MKVSSLLMLLQIAYGYLFLVYVPLSVVQLHAYLNAFLSFTALTFIVGTHSAICREIGASKTNRKFFVFSSVWAIQLAIFLLDQGINLVFPNGSFALIEIDAFLLLALLIATSLSFVIKTPFFYVRTENKGYRAVGFAGLLLFSWITVGEVVALANHIKFTIETKAIKSFLKHIEKRGTPPSAAPSPGQEGRTRN